MKKIKLLTIALTILSSVISCKKENVKLPVATATNDDFLLAPNAFIIPDSINDELISFDSLKMIFKSTNPLIQNLKVGDIILADYSEKTPDGYLSKINTINKNGQTIEIFREDASLRDAFQELHINDSFPLSLENRQVSTNKRLSGNLPSILINIPTLTINSLRLNASAEFETYVVVEIDISLSGNRNYFYCSVSSNKKFHIDFSSNSTININKTWTPIYKTLGFIELPAGILLRPQFILQAGVNGTLNSNVSSSFDYNAWSYYQVTYNNSNWQYIKDNNKTYSTAYNDLTYLSYLRLFIKPTIQLKFNNLVGNATTSLSAGFYGEYNYQNRNWCSLDIGLNVDAYANLKLLGSSIVEKDFHLYDYRFNLAKCNGNPIPANPFPSNPTTPTNPTNPSTPTIPWNPNPSTGNPIIEVTGTTNFGSIPLNQFQQKNFTIKNNGNANLVIFGISNSNNEFGVSSASYPITIYPNTSIEFSVYITPHSIGNKSTTITISHNAFSGSGDILNINASIISDNPNTSGNPGGTPVDPGGTPAIPSGTPVDGNPSTAYTVSPPNLIFLDRQTNGSVWHTSDIYIKNNTSISSTYTIRLLDNNYDNFGTTVVTQFSIPPNTERRQPVVFHPKIYGYCTAIAEININGSIYIVNLRGYGY